MNDWEGQGAEVKLLNQCVSLSLNSITPSEHPDTLFTLIKVSYEGRCEVVKKAKGRAIKPEVMYQVKKGQLLFSTIRATDGAIGIIPEELDGALVSGSYRVFDVGPADYDTTYLWAILRSHELRADMQSLSPGSGRYTTYWPDVGLIKVPWLSEEKRKAIGEKLLEVWELEKQMLKVRAAALEQVASLGVESGASVSRWQSSKAPT